MSMIMCIAGWWLAEKNIAQISLNLTDMDVNIALPCCLYNIH